MNLEFNKFEKNIIGDGILKKLNKYPNIIIFGAGQSGEYVFNILKKYNIKVNCFADNYPAKQGRKKLGVMVYSFEECMGKYPDAAIVIASMWMEEIRCQIEEYDDKLLNRTYDLLTSMAWETTNMIYESSEYDYISNNYDAFEMLYGGLADEVSKNTLEGILNYRLTREKRYLKEIKSCSKIYTDDDVLTENAKSYIVNGVIVDGGAFDGDTVEYFINELGKDVVLNLHCYEAEEKNYQKIQGKISNYKPHNVQLHKSALWNESGKHISFSGQGLSGQVHDETVAEKSIITEKIDDIACSKVSFIKLDIEGAERNALEGARDVIEANKPILAICAYHLQDDLLVLYNFIKLLKCNYKVYLRHYMYSSGDTIMYAMPDSI